MGKLKTKFYWSRKDTAELFDISVITLDQWVAKDCPFDMVDVEGKKKPQKRFYIPNVIEWKTERTTGNKKNNDLQQERARLAKEQADGQELKNAVLRKELIPVKMLEFALADISEQVSSILESIPLKVKKNLPKLTASEVEIITREIKKAMNAASRTKIDYEKATDDFK